MSGSHKWAKPACDCPFDGRVRRLVGHGPAIELFVDELPRVRTVQTPNSYRGNEFWIEVPQVHAMLRARRWLQGLPMCDAPASSAVNRAQRLVSLDVLRGGFRVALDLDRAELKVDPRSADAPAQRAVAS